MFESKYSKVLTVVLVIIIIAIVALLGLLGYDLYQKYYIEKDALAFAENYEQEIDNTTVSDNTTNDENTTTNNTTEENVTNPLNRIENETTENTTVTQTQTKANPTYKGFGVLGKMSIPAISFDYPILEKLTKNAIETSVVYLYGPGINQVGNTVIIGHNYRNGLFFSNNKKLKVGDKIYITDNDGNKLTYTIYNKFETSPDDISFYQRDTNSRPEVTLSTCTDDSSARLIIFAKAE